MLEIYNTPRCKASSSSYCLFATMRPSNLNVSCQILYQCEAPYSPSALHSFAASRASACSPAEISAEQFIQCLNVHSDSNHQLQHKQHAHLCTSQQDHAQVYKEGLSDIRDS